MEPDDRIELSASVYKTEALPLSESGKSSKDNIRNQTDDNAANEIQEILHLNSFPRGFDLLALAW